MMARRSQPKFVARGATGVGLLLVLTLLGASCAPQQDDAEGKSQFLKELKKDQYSEAEAPTNIPVFRWDFSNKHVHAYAYQQEARGKSNIWAAFGGKSDDAEQMRMSTKGALLVKSQGDGTAELVLKDMKTSLNMDLANDEEREVMEQTMPPIVMQGMKEDGSGPFGGVPEELFLRMLFPLPTRDLNVGESVDVPAQMPFNAWGSLLQVKGRRRITLARYVTIGERTCAQLEVDIDISDLRVPSEMEGEYKSSTKGASVFYFDVAERCFVSGTTAILMQFSIDAPMPKIRMPGEKTQDMPKRSKISTVSDNLIRVSLKP